MHHILANNVTGAAATTDLDTPAIADPSFTSRNGHWIFTEPYRLLAAGGFGATLSKFRLSSPTLDQMGQPNVLPLNHALNPPSPMNIMDCRNIPFPLPNDEEIRVLLSMNAIEQDSAFMLVAPPEWTQQIPAPGQIAGVNPYRILVRTSQSITLVAQNWSADSALTFDQLPRGGWYLVVGAWAAGTNVQAFRLNFPRYELVRGRKLFPGAIAMASDNDFHYPRFEQDAGVWGKFHTFEPPFVSAFGSAAGAQTVRVYLDIIFAGAGPRDAPY